MNVDSWVCPRCLKPLSQTAPEELACGKCGRVYPVEEGIPVLVDGAARHLEEMEAAVRENPAWYESSQLAWHDAGPCRHHLRRRRDFVESILRKRLSPGGKAGRLLDLGCGDGANARWLADFTESLDACDYNLLRLRRCGKLMGDRARLCLANVHRLPYPDDFFDVVFFNHVLEHVPDDERALESIHRVLRPGGLFILGTPNEGCGWWQLAYRLQPETLKTSDHVHFYTAREVEEKLEASGFELEETHPTGWGPPHWKLDEWMRRSRWVDGTFEFLGSRLLRGQAASLYLVANKPEIQKKKKKSGAQVFLYAPSMREEWEDLVERSPQAWLYHKRDFIELSGESKSLAELSLTAFKEDRLVGILPLNYFAPQGSPVLGSLAFGAAGPALDPELGEREAAGILRSLVDRALRLTRQIGGGALELSLPPLAPAFLSEAHGASPLEPLGFEGRAGSTYVLDLSLGEEELLANFRPTARQTIKKAKKAGVTIREADRDSDLNAYYEIHRRTYERTAVPPHPREYFEGIFTRLAPAGLARIWTAEIEGEPIGFLNVGTYKEGVLYWTGCSLEKALESGANYALQWRAIREALAGGASHYEMGEAFPGRRGDKMAGLNTFKSAFGAERRPFHKGRIEAGSGGVRRRPSRARLSLYYLKEAMKAFVGKR